MKHTPNLTPVFVLFAMVLRAVVGSVDYSNGQASDRKHDRSGFARREAEAQR